MRRPRRTKAIVLPPIRPNVGIRIIYQRQLDDMIKEMGADVRAAILATYAANPPEAAMDASPAADLTTTIRGLKSKWLKRFDRLSGELARYFAQSTADRVDAHLQASLKKAGFAVEFRMTAAQNDMIAAAVSQNVSLIKSIPEQHFTQIEGLVMRGTAEGRNAHVIAEGLQRQMGVTRRRAALIARSQINMATADLTRCRQIEMGYQARWRHSFGGRHPRPSHVANNGKEYNPADGWFDPDAKVWTFPGCLLNCRCVSQTVIFPKQP